MEPVYILGGGRTDFKRNLKKEGKTIRDLITESGRQAIADAKIDPAEIEAAAVGNFNAGQFTKQLHLGAFVPEIDPALHGIPTMQRKPRVRAARFPWCSVHNGSPVDFTTPFWWWGRSNRRQCRRSTVAMSSALRPIITSRNRNTATSCSRNCSERSPKCTWKNMEHPATRSPGWRIRTTLTPASIRSPKCATPI